ncbi:MAG: autotransporter outer membrane beta-barrel domain-containing protein [Myxococcota bacterium]|nr:autotransporter outer membrane beta-barrel domain-containing protein [Myxococcota bacterium]
MSTTQSKFRLSIARTMVPALLAVGLMGSLPDWVTIAQAEGYYLSPESAQNLNANVLTTALANSSAISMAIGNRTGRGSAKTAGGFRIDGIRIGDVQLDGTYFAEEDSAAGGAAAGQLGGFLSAVGGFGEQKGLLDYSNGGLIGGIDYQFTEALIGGLSINWINTNTTFVGNSGGADRDTYGATLYTGYSEGHLNVDALFNYSFSDYDMTRSIAAGDVASGINNSDEIFLSASASYDLEAAGFKVGPAVRVDFVKVWMDSYSETGAADANNNATYNAFDVTSFTTDVGGEASYDLKLDSGLFTPRVYGYWVHEFQNDSQTLSGSTLGGGAFTTILSSPDRDYMRLGAGATLNLQGGLEIYFDYEALVGFKGVSSNQFAAGGRFEF